MKFPISFEGLVKIFDDTLRFRIIGYDRICLVMFMWMTLVIVMDIQF